MPILIIALVALLAFGIIAILLLIAMAYEHRQLHAADPSEAQHVPKAPGEKNVA